MVLRLPIAHACVSKSVFYSYTCLSVDSLSPCSWQFVSWLSMAFSLCTIGEIFSSTHFGTSCTTTNMPQPTAQQKHDILVHCQSRRASDSEVDVAAQHGVTVTRQTLYNWRRQWNGTRESLEHKKGAGRPPLLTPSEVSRHIRAPILAANRAQRAIHYPDVLQQIQTKTGKKIALRTLQHYGKEKCQAKERTTHKRTRAECECRHALLAECACVLYVYDADSCV